MTRAQSALLSHRLDLSFNCIEKISGLEQLEKLTDLSLFSNQIAQIRPRLVDRNTGGEREELEMVPSSTNKTPAKRRRNELVSGPHIQKRTRDALGGAERERERERERVRVRVREGERAARALSGTCTRKGRHRAKAQAKIEGLSKCKQLQCLSLGNNKISALDSSVVRLRCFKGLQLLNLEGNPVTRSGATLKTKDSRFNPPRNVLVARP